MFSNFIYLVQTQTTVGFLSTNKKKLSYIKKRSDDIQMINEIDTFETLKHNTRIPNKFKKIIRNSHKTTFIYPNKKSFRIVSRNSRHYDFIKKFNLLYSTSANKTKESFNHSYALSKADIIVEDNNGFFEGLPSKIYKINNQKIQKIR